MSTYTAVIIAILVLLCSCGESAPTDSCSLSTELSGAIEREVQFDDTHGCGSSYNDTTRTRVMAYGGLGNLLVRIVVLDTDNDAVGTQTARVEIVDQMSRGWQTPDDCSIDTSENELVDSVASGEARSIRAVVTCSSPAVPDMDNSETAAINIGSIKLFSCVLC